MKMILAHHEAILHFLGYATGMILVGFFCFRILFIAMGRWIVNLNCKLQNRIAKLKAEEDQRKINRIKKFEDGVDQFSATEDKEYVPKCDGPIGRTPFNEDDLQ